QGRSRRVGQADSHRQGCRLHAARGRTMTRWWRSHSVRVRLTLWYVAAMIVVIGVYASVEFAFVNRTGSDALDQRRRGDFSWEAAMVDQTPEGKITGFEEDTVGDEERPWLQVWSPE